MTLKPPDLAILLAHYPALAGLPAHLLATYLAERGWTQVPEGALMFAEHSPCGGFPFVVEGQVRVSRGSPVGRELELYRVNPGEVCVVSAACSLGSMPMHARGVATRSTRLLLVDPAALVAWTENQDLRRFILGVMADRMADLMELVEAVAFRRLDQRLAAALLGHGAEVRTTHQQLADELGTAREIVSRLLKRFEADGLVRLGREMIAICDAAALRRRA